HRMPSRTTAQVQEGATIALGQGDDPLGFLAGGGKALRGKHKRVKIVPEVLVFEPFHRKPVYLPITEISLARLMFTPELAAFQGGKIMERSLQFAQWITGARKAAGQSMAESSPSDQDLLRQLSRGNEAAFSTLYERFQGPLYRFVLHMSGNTATAEEVT